MSKLKKQSGAKPKPKPARTTTTDRSGLTALQRRFLCEYVIDTNATQAAIRAGYSPKTAHAQGSRLLKKVEVVSALAKKQQELANRLDISADRVLREWATIAFSNQADYVTVQADGSAVIDLSKCTREQMSALGEIQVDEYTDGRGDGARPVKRVRIKFHSKTQALEALSKHLGLFAEDNKQRGIEAFLAFLQERAQLAGTTNRTNAKLVESTVVEPAREVAEGVPAADQEPQQAPTEGDSTK